MGRVLHRENICALLHEASSPTHVQRAKELGGGIHKWFCFLVMQFRTTPGITPSQFPIMSRVRCSRIIPEVVACFENDPSSQLVQTRESTSRALTASRAWTATHVLVSCSSKNIGNRAIVTKPCYIVGHLNTCLLHHLLHLEWDDSPGPNV